MAKNNKLINSMREIARRNRYDNIKMAEERNTPLVYAGIALALYNRGWRHKRINNLFVESQRIWESYADSDDERSMIEICEDLTGILLMNPNAEEL